MRDDAGLPPAVAALVDGVVGRTRLTAVERGQVRDELEDHFRLALGNGRDAARAIAEFGDPALAAVLIGRARRRARSPAQRLVRSMPLLVAATLAAALVPYGYSAWRLGAAPATRSAPTVETGLDWLPAETRSSRAALEAAREEARNGRPDAAAERLRRAIEAATSLRKAAALPPEIEAARRFEAIVQTFTAVEDALHPRDRTELRVRLEQADFTPRRSVVAAALEETVDRVYPADADGHPTRDGLRSIRRLKGTPATRRADLLEPAWFLRAAPREEAAAAARTLLEAAWPGSGAADATGLRRALDTLAAEDRVFAVTLVMTGVADALEAEASAHAALRRLPR